jgi:hypothetical protein
VFSIEYVLYRHTRARTHTYCLQVLASDALSDFLDLRQQVIDTRPLVPCLPLSRVPCLPLSPVPSLPLPRVRSAEQEGDLGLSNNLVNTIGTRRQPTNSNALQLLRPGSVRGAAEVDGGARVEEEEEEEVGTGSEARVGARVGVFSSDLDARCVFVSIECVLYRMCFPPTSMPGACL